jgi:hypothetical protein
MLEHEEFGEFFVYIYATNLFAQVGEAGNNGEVFLFAYAGGF